MKCGEFLKYAKDKVIIQQKSLNADNYGSVTNTWVLLTNAYAWVKPVTAFDFERVQNAQLRGVTTYKVIIRYQSTLADVKDVASYRLKLDGRIHNIKSVKLLDNTMKNYGKAYIEILTEENATEVS